MNTDALIVMAVLMLLQQVLLFAVIANATRERKTFLRAIMSRNAGEFVATERASQPQKLAIAPPPSALDEMWRAPPREEE